MSVAQITQTISKPFDNCDHYHKHNGQPILDEGYIVTDWLSVHQLYLFVDDQSSIVTAAIIARAVDDFIKWLQYKGSDTYNAVSVNYPCKNSCLIAPAIWCGDDRRLSEYLALETEEGESEQINYCR